VLLVLMLNTVAATAETGLGTSFTYQGQLQRDGVPATGNYEIEFKLYDALDGGNPVGNPDTVLARPPVSQGLFTVELNFGADVFTGYERYLQIGVRPSDSQEPFTILSPRQRLLPAPYAHYALNAGAASFVPWQGVLGAPAGFADGVDNDTTYSAGAGLTLGGTQFRVDTASIQARVTGECTAGSSIRTIYDDGTVVCETDDNSGGTVTGVTAGAGLTGGTITGFGTISANFGTTSGTVADGGHLHDSRYWRHNGDSAGPDDFLGTTNTRPLEFRVNNERALLLDAGGESVNVVGGFSDNTVKSGATGATISGGGRVGDANQVMDNYGTIGGGYGNRSGDDVTSVTTAEGATVGGGIANTASKFGCTVAGGSDNQASASHAVVAGGHMNLAGNTACTVGGGENNQASGAYATVAGGTDNVASGNYSTVSGGSNNAAAGSFSFAAGRRANASFGGCFVWGDATNADVTCAGPNRFIARASGGIFFYSNTDGTAGVRIAPGGAGWLAVSDRNAKVNFAPVDARAIAARVAALPIETWNYKSQEASIHHIGPMAQDFYAAFSVGEDERFIGTIDADGVALAAIQGLYQMAQEKDALIAKLQEQNAALEARISALERAAQR